MFGKQYYVELQSFKGLMLIQESLQYSHMISDKQKFFDTSSICNFWIYLFETVSVIYYLRLLQSYAWVIVQNC